MKGDFLPQRLRRLAVEKYALLDADTREAYEGFAAGVNRYIEVHPEEFPVGFAPRFTGYDIAARDVEGASTNDARAFLRRLQPPRAANSTTSPSNEGADPIEEGSNA